MINHWTVFEGIQNGRRSERARVTLSPKKIIGMNAHAYKAFGSPSAVELMIDGNRNLLGLRRCDPDKKNAFKIKRHAGTFYKIAAGSFLTHFRIKPTARCFSKK